MIARTVITIHLREGVTAKLLLTPALYGVAKERGIDLTTAEKGKVLETYARIAYCAAISAWEVDAVDNPTLGEFPFKYEDFFLWAWGNPKEFGKVIDDILLALTGKSAREYAREAQEEQQGEEKKKMTQRKRPLLWITGRSKPSS